MGAMEQLIDHEDGPLQPAAAGAEGGGGLCGPLQQLIDFGDRRLQAASFFIVWVCCVLINTVVLSPAANLEHKFVGFVVLIIRRLARSPHARRGRCRAGCRACGEIPQGIVLLARSAHAQQLHRG